LTPSNHLGRFASRIPVAGESANICIAAARFAFYRAWP
jgi:hypothetical protein